MFMASLLPLLVVFLLEISRFASVSGAAAICPRPDRPSFDLRGADTFPQCPLSIELFPPAEINGEALTVELSRGQKSDLYSIFFYASWCPFSQHLRPLFDGLSSMFPEIRHFMVEESSALPSVFSIYGVHSFPSILIVNQTRMIHYYGPKDLSSLVYFYRKATGLEPVVYLSEDYVESAARVLETERSHGLEIYSPREIFARDPYLALATLFIVLRVFLYMFPGILSKFKVLYDTCMWNLNLGIFGGSNQLLGRVLQAIDIKRVWSKLGLFNKTRNFQKGANNARVWASLASVSLGESTSSRSSTPDS